MIANFGFGVLFITFLVTLYSVFAAIYGDRKQVPALVESARRAMLWHDRKSSAAEAGAK